MIHRLTDVRSEIEITENDLKLIDNVAKFKNFQNSGEKVDALFSDTVCNIKIRIHT